VQWLRDEIAKKQAEIQSSQRQYRDLIESKYESASKYSPSARKHSSGGSNNLTKLESEMQEIKNMLKDYGMKNHQTKPPARFQDVLDDMVDLGDKENSSLGDNDDAFEVKAFLSKEKAEIKE